MKKMSLLIAGALTLSAVHIPTAQAWPVVCVNCGTEWTQIANNIQLASQYAEQVRHTINQVEQLRWQMQNTKRLANGDWGNTFEQLSTLNKLAQRGDSIAFSSGDLMGQMNNTYKGYDNWQRDISPQEYEQNYKKLSRTLGDTASASLSVANGVYKQKQEDERLLNTLEQQSQGAGGRMEAIQAGNQISAQVVRHLQKIETLLSSQIQMTAAFMQTEVEKEQLEKAQEAKFKQTDFPKREDRTLGRFELIQ
jgi:P-type conjugative transfer protein TrbJ